MAHRWKLTKIWEYSPLISCPYCFRSATQELKGDGKTTFFYPCGTIMSVLDRHTERLAPMFVMLLLIAILTITITASIGDWINAAIWIVATGTLLWALKNHR